VGWTTVELSFASRQRKVSPFLGAFAKLRKATISFIIFVVCTSARMVKLGSHWTDFQEI
jgi:hypothetical protein